MAEKAILLLHGWAAHSGVFIRQIGVLKGEYEVICPDLYEIMSEISEDTFSLDDLVDTIAQEIRDEGIKELILFGWSLGGCIAVRLYEKLKDITKGVILTGFSPSFIKADSNPHGMPAGEIDKLKTRIEQSLPEAIEEFVKLVMNGFVYTFHFEMIKELILDEITDERKPLLLSSLDILKDNDFSDDVKAIAAKTLIIHGTQDKLCALQAVQDMAALIDDSELKVLEDGSHIPFFTNSDEFNSIVQEFINSFD